MIGIDGKPLQSGEIFLVAMILLALLAFVVYVYIIAPKAMKEKARHIAEVELLRETEESERRKKLTPDQRKLEDKNIEQKRTEAARKLAIAQEAKQQSQLTFIYGKKVPALVCPHCQSKGSVRRKQVTRVAKIRVNSVAARAVGLGTNTETTVMQLRCDECEMKWDVA